MNRVVLFGLALGLSASGSGCSLAPKSFRDMIHPAPIVRARATGMGEGQPESVAVPALIERLNDPDKVVRMTANEALKKRTRRDFGFVSWASPEERTRGVERWKAWWKDRMAQADYPKDDQLQRVADRPDRGRKARRRDKDGGQGGPAPSWPATPTDNTTETPPA